MSEHPLLIKYYDGLVEELNARIPHALSGDAEAIHDARVATRRLSAMLNVFEPQLSRGLRERFQRGLKAFRRALGPMRDLDVMIAEFRRLPDSQMQVRDFLLENLQRARAEGRARMDKLNAPRLLGMLGSWWGLREELKELSAGEMLRQSLSGQLDDFCRCAALHVSPSTAETPQAVELNPHELRIAGKALRYTLEATLADGVAIPAPVIHSFKKMQDLLGTWHDLAVLSNQIMQICLEEELALKDAERLRACLTLMRRTTRRAAARLENFRTLWRQDGERLRQEIVLIINQNPDAPPVTPING
ncbi:MAG TPA: CHAD domain-containing protein [Planctomycetota bacterium]|jgi:CHAD domain-containing protein